MIFDHDSHRIVEFAHGELAVYPATLATAQAILADYLRFHVPREVIELADEMAAGKMVGLFAQETILEAIGEVLDGQPGAELPRVRRLAYGPKPKTGEDDRPQVVLTAVMQEETALWLFRNKLPTAPRHLEAHAVAALAPETALSYLALFATRVGTPIRYVPESALEAANELHILRLARWKDDACESSVVRRYLRYVAQWTPRDVRFELCADQRSYGHR